MYDYYLFPLPCASKWNRPIFDHSEFKIDLYHVHVYQSYNVSLCSCFGARTLHNINNLGLCIRVYVYNILLI